MTEPDADIELHALFAQDLPPAHDADFVVAVAGRAARHRLLFDLAWAALLAALSAVVLWALAPLVDPLLEPVGKTLLMFAPAVMMLAVVLLLAHPRTSSI
jgi:hypothetical protein